MTRHVLWVGFAMVAALAGCGSRENADEGYRQAFDTFRSAFARQSAEPAPITQGQIDAVLQQSNMPMVLAIVEKTKTQAVLGEIARNGRYATFASADRQAIVLKDGLVASTRGLGADLMSSDTADLERLVRARKAGTARYALRFLDGEDQRQEVLVTCATTVGASAPVVLGAMNTSGQIVKAACSGDVTFTNAYVVGSDGFVLASQVWIGEINGTLATQILRR